MTGKNLTFKLVLDGDSKGLVSAAKQSESVTTKVFETIKAEADKLKVASVDAAKEIGNIIPDELNKNTKAAKDGLAALSNAAENAGETAKRAGFEIGEAIPGDAVQLAESLGNKFFTAAKEIEALGDKSTISAGELRAMSSAGEQGLNALNLALKASQAELVRLQSTDGTLKDIEIAKGRVFSIQDAINEASSAFNYYQGVAINAMKGVDNATQSAINKVQQFSSVDLTGVVGEAQTASRAIESMGDGATISSKELERVGQLGTQAINSLQNELQQANLELKALSQSSDAVPLNKFNEATAKVNALEDALSLTKTAYTDFQTKASTAMGSVSSSTDKASNSAMQAGHAIYAALGKTPPTVVNDAIANLSKKLEDFKANSKMPAEEVARVTRLTEQEIARLRSELDGVDTSASKANMGMGTLSKGIDVTRFAVTALTGAMAALGIGLGIRELAQAADSYTNLSARINIATSEGGNFKQAMAGVHQIALATNSSLDATANLFAKINDTGKEMGMTQQQALDLTRTINQAIKIGGGSAQASEAAVQQFIQALQSGVLRGDEFNSIMEQAPGLTSAMAKGLGVTTGELRKMAENGELGAERVVKAIQSQASEVQKTYDKFPLTISNALQKIATSWQILIGEMDQANGASATVAQWLVTLADNMDVVETLLKDIGQGFVWVGDQLKKIDPATIDALKASLSTAYDAVKSMASAFGNGLEIAGDQLNTILGSIFDFNSGIDTASDKTNGLTKMLQALNATFGFIADGFDGIGIVANLLAGVFYDVTAAWLNLKSKFTWGDTKKEIIADMEAMALKAQDYYDRASNGAMDFKSKGIAAIQEISKTQSEKNHEAVAGSTATFAELSRQNEEFTQKSKDLAAERKAIDARLDQARKDGNQSTIDSIIQKSNELEGREKEHAANKAALDKDMLASAQGYAEAVIKANGGVMSGAMQADLLTKGFIVTMDEAGKVSVRAGESSAQAAEKAKAKEEALKLAKENVKKADEEYLAFQKQAAIERAALDQQIQQAKASGDLNELKQAQDKVNQINAKEAELANNRNIRIAELNQETTGSGKVAESAYSRASAAASQFGVDLDISLNKVSKSFNSSGNDLNDLKNRLDEAGIAGKQAGGILYQAWEDWLSKAKSQAEIDFAKAKLKEFGDQGQISTSQVEQGLIAIKLQAQKLPDDIDPVTASFKRLGIETKENLKLAAQQALMDFINVRDSGKATAEGVQKAYEKAAQAAAASGDAGRISAVNALNAGRNLEVQIDETGKAAVKSMDEWSKANDHVRDSARGIGDGYRQAGQVAREEAKSSTEAWRDAVAAASKQFDAEMKRQSKSLSEGIYNYNSYSKADVISQLKSKGYSDKEAEKLAGDIWSQGLAADRSAKEDGMTKTGNLAVRALISQEFDAAASKGLTTQWGTNKINDLLNQLNGNSLSSVGAPAKAPPVDVNSLAPNVNVAAPSAPATPTSKIVQNNISINGKTISIPVAEENQSNFNDFLSELEMLKKSS